MKTTINIFGKYVYHILVALDQLLNTIFGGDPDDTLSSRLGRDRDSGHIVGCVLCKFLDIFENDHCTKSIERNRVRHLRRYDKPN
jgi:hypothetical protein